MAPMRMLLTIATLLALTPGCVSRAAWQAWKADVQETAKAMSGTGEHMGWSSEARDVERSLGNHRKRAIVE